MPELTSPQADAIGELINLGIGRAAAALSDITDDEVMLSVPKVELLTPAEAIARFADRGRSLTGVCQAFDGDIDGQALLIFPEDQCLQLGRALTAVEIELDAMTELEENALLEIGNVILNACLSVFSDCLGVSLTTALPEITRGTWAELLEGRVGREHVIALLCIDFALRVQGVDGFVSFVLDLGSTRRLRDAVDRYVTGVLERARNG